MMQTLLSLLHWIDHSLIYRILLWFYGLYPVLMACVWVVLSLFFWARREKEKKQPVLVSPLPLVSVVIAAFEEEYAIGRTLDALLKLDYPSFEIVVVDDGSSDRTSEIVRSYIDKGPVRLVQKEVNEGKAMALNDALPVCRGEILLLIDADIIVTPDLLNNMVPHFRSSRVGAVTGNPRVANRSGLLKRLQAIEFSSIISMQRRAQRIWGRVMTVSGAVVAFRRSAILDVGLFTPSMATEDIDMTWRMQMRFWDVRYEPRAVVWMEVPPNLREFWKQRRRWVRGLAQVLRRYRPVPLHWKWRRLWPVFYESTVSILWAFTFVGITLYWILCLLAGYHPYGASPIPNFWGMLIATACIIQLITGALEDRKYDPKIASCLPEAIYYPLIYWTLMSTITCIYTIGALFRKPPQMQRWKIQRSVASLLLAILLATSMSAQTRSAADLINDGNAAAHNDDHLGAIRNYEQAIAADPSVRDSLVLKLGQQYLWADKAAQAAQLLGEYVKQYPSECSAKSTYALALSWSNQLSSAEFEYRDIANHCPDLKNDALLGEARTLRWRDRNTTAAKLYEQVLQSGTEAQRNDAKLGLALIKLAQDQNRSARDDFRSLASLPKPDPASIEGLAVSDLHLGLPEQAQRDLQLGNTSGARSRQLDDLSEHIRTINSPQIAPAFQFFHDADGTNYYGGEARSSFALTTRSTVAAFFTASNLSRDAISIDGRGGGLALDYRANESLAFHGEGHYTQYGGINFNPFTGELDAIVSPTDRSRLDLAVARITIWDAPTALQNHLAGTFGSIGLDQKITMQDQITAGFSATGWNDGNRRLVFRLTPSHRFEGAPRITLSLPVLYQNYDRGFTFGLFSPTSYTEITPALDIHFRRSRIWNFDLGGRLGGQKEAALEWKPMAAFHATVERDLKHGWGLKATVSHSSSNVASSTGFSRTSFFFTVARTF